MPLVEMWYGRPGKLIRPNRPDRNLDAFIYGITKPSRANVGLQGAGVAENQLSNYAGDINVTTPNQTISRLLVTGYINNKTQGTIVKECKVVGPQPMPTTGETALVNNFQNGNDMHVSFCDLEPQTPNYRTDGVKGHHYTAERNYVRATSDGFGGFNNSASGSREYADNTVRGNMVDGLARFDDMGGITPDGTHNDGYQAQGGRNHFVYGNYFRGFSVAGDYSDGRILILAQGTISSPNVNAVINFQVYQNWYEGFGAQVKLECKSFTESSMMVWGNRHDASTAWQDGSKKYLVRIGVNKPILLLPPVPAGGYPLPNAIDFYGMETLNNGTILNRVTTGAGIHYDGSTY